MILAYLAVITVLALLSIAGWCSCIAASERAERAEVQVLDAKATRDALVDCAKAGNNLASALLNIYGDCFPRHDATFEEAATWFLREAPVRKREWVPDYEMWVAWASAHRAGRILDGGNR